MLAAVAAAIVAAVLYGLLIGTKHEIGYAALGVGALVGFALGKVGGRNPARRSLGIPLSLLGVYAGQLFGIALSWRTAWASACPRSSPTTSATSSTPGRTDADFMTPLLRSWARGRLRGAKRAG